MPPPVPVSVSRQGESSLNFACKIRYMNRCTTRWLDEYRWTIPGTKLITSWKSRNGGVRALIPQNRNRRPPSSSPSLPSGQPDVKSNLPPAPPWCACCLACVVRPGHPPSQRVRAGLPNQERKAPPHLISNAALAFPFLFRPIQSNPSLPLCFPTHNEGSKKKVK